MCRINGNVFCLVVIVFNQREYLWIKSSELTLLLLIRKLYVSLKFYWGILYNTFGSFLIFFSYYNCMLCFYVSEKDYVAMDVFLQFDFNFSWIRWMLLKYMLWYIRIIHDFLLVLQLCVMFYLAAKWKITWQWTLSCPLFLISA